MDRFFPEDEELLMEEEQPVDPMMAGPSLPPPVDPVTGMGEMPVPAPIPPDPSMIDPMMGLGDPMMGPPVPDPSMTPPVDDPLSIPMGDPLSLMQPIPEPEVDIEEEQYGPTPPVWYRKPPRPKLDEVLEDAECERQRHELRIQMAMEMISRLNLEGAGMFERDREAVESGEIEVWIDTSLRDEHDAATAYIAKMDWSAECPFRNTIDLEEADQKEDLVHYLWECWERQHARAGNASLKIAIPDILMKYGMLVASVIVDPGDDECGLRMRLLDPATCYPVHEGHRGLGAMYRIYKSTASQVIGDFGDADGKVERKIKKIVGANNDGRYDRHYEAEVVEYWDRNWVLVAFDQQLLMVREHGYTYVPFVVTYGGFGQQNFTSTRDNFLVDGEGNTWRRFGVTSGEFSSKQDDMGRISQPYLYRRVKQHDIGEAVGGRFLTALRRAIKPPLVIKQTIASAESNDVEVDYDEEGQTFIGAEDAIELLPNLPSPEVIQPVIDMLAQGKATSMATGIMMGQSPHSQASGSAIDILAQAGYERWTPIVLGCETFLTEVSELALTEYRDFGLLLGMEPNIGTLYVPRRNPNPRTGQAPVHEVTPDLLRRVGIRVAVKFYKFNPASIASLAQGLAVLKSMGIMPKIDAIKIVGWSADPQGVLRRKEEEDLDDVPEVKQEKTLRRLVKEAEDAALRGDYASAEERMAKAIFIASMMQRTQQTAQPAPTGGGLPPTPMPPGIPPIDVGRDPSTGRPLPAPPPGIPVSEAIPDMAVGGLSMPMMGIPVGTKGGRPPGS